MTDWPLVCDRCGGERWTGILYAGLCPGCHSDQTCEQLAAASSNGGGQTGLGDFA